jgi:hypothetical protein
MIIYFYCLQNKIRKTAEFVVYKIDTNKELQTNTKVTTIVKYVFQNYGVHEFLRPLHLCDSCYLSIQETGEGFLGKYGESFLLLS